MEKRRYVADTTAIISYFSSLFKKGSQISQKGLIPIKEAFNDEGNALLTIPSIVFVEIFDKWFRGEKLSDEDFRAKFIAEVFEPVRRSPNIEIREIDLEVLEAFLSLDDTEINLENHDRIVLASAVVLQAQLITSDDKIIRYVKKYKMSPLILT